jgi:hypothetical protein
MTKENYQRIFNELVSAYECAYETSEDVYRSRHYGVFHVGNVDRFLHEKKRQINFSLLSLRLLQMLTEDEPNLTSEERNDLNWQFSSRISTVEDVFLGNVKQQM